MLQFRNNTPFAGTILIATDPECVETVYTIIKATFTLGETIALAEEQLPVLVRDEFNGAPLESSLLAPSDVALAKPGTDVLLVGTAGSADGKPVRQMDVSLRVGALHKVVRVFGDRFWKSTMLGHKASEPEPYDAMPLVWERAFGGTVNTGDKANPLFQTEDRNPIGIGFHPTGETERIERSRLPNLEDPQQLISKPTDRPTPACFGPVCPHWEPRRSYAGTYDEPWQKTRAPHLPEDFDVRFFHTAPADQVVDGYLDGDEIVEVEGTLPNGHLSFRLPRLEMTVGYLIGQTSHTEQTQLDTVIIDTDEQRLQMVWRSSISCDKKALELRQIDVSLLTPVDSLEELRHA